MAVPFETTNWSLIVRANASTTAVRRNALAGLCEAYWYPLYAFARRRGCDHEDASDLTQAFFVHLIEKHALEDVTPTLGRFRAFLIASFKNFQSEGRQRAQAQKRGGNLIRLPWDEAHLEARYGTTTATDEDPERLFVRQWALTVIDRARLRLRAHYLESDKADEFEALWPCLPPQQGELSIAQLARALGKTEATTRVVLSRFRRRFGSALRAEVAATLRDPQETDAELRFLLSALANDSQPLKGR